MPYLQPGTFHALHNSVTAQTVLAFLCKYISTKPETYSDLFILLPVPCKYLVDRYSFLLGKKGRVAPKLAVFLGSAT